MSAPDKSEELNDRIVARLTHAIALRFEFRCAHLNGVHSLAPISEQYAKLTGEWLWETPQDTHAAEVLVNFIAASPIDGRLTEVLDEETIVGCDQDREDALHALRRLKGWLHDNR